MKIAVVSLSQFPVVAFAVEDMDAAVERLRAHQVELPWGVEESPTERWANCAFASWRLGVKKIRSRVLEFIGN